jgi:hypothetical protein
MRPETFRYKMNRAFDYWTDTKSISSFLPLLREMDRVWKKWSERDDDYRTGDQTYGYADEYRIEYDMWYISDRWNCAFRLKWLMDGLSSEKIT